MNTNRPQKLRDSGSEHLSDELISTHVNDETTEEEKLAISQHLSECGDCATRLEDQLEIVMLLKALPAVPAPRSFALRAEVANPAIAWFPMDASRDRVRHSCLCRPFRVQPSLREHAVRPNAGYV